MKIHLQKVLIVLWFIGLGQISCAFNSLFSTRSSPPQPPLNIRLEVEEVFHLIEKRDSLSDIAFSPDSQMLVVANGHIVWLLSTQTGQEIRQLEKQINGVIALSISPDSKLLAFSATEDDVVQLWDVEAGHKLRDLVGHTGLVRASKFSPDSKILATASDDDQTIRFWEVATGQEILKINTGRARTDIAFSPDGQSLISGGVGVAQLWDIKTGEKIREFDKPMGPSGGVAFSPDGRLIIIGGDKEAVIWEVETGLDIHRLPHSKSGVDVVDFHPDGKIVATAGFKQGIHFWSVETGQELLRLPLPNPLVGSIAFSPDGQLFAVSNVDNLKVWKLKIQDP